MVEPLKTGPLRWEINIFYGMKMYDMDLICLHKQVISHMDHGPTIVHIHEIFGGMNRAGSLCMVHPLFHRLLMRVSLGVQTESGNGSVKLVGRHDVYYMIIYYIL